MLLGQKYFCDEMIKTKQYVRDGTTSSVEKSKLPQRRMNKFFRCVNHSGYKYRKINRGNVSKTYISARFHIHILSYRENKNIWYNLLIDSNNWSHKYEKEAVFKPGTCYSFTIDDKGKNIMWWQLSFFNWFAWKTVNSGISLMNAHRE